MIVYKILICGCCGSWIDYVKKVGFIVDVYDMDDLGLVKECLGVFYVKGFCYMVEVDGYVIEGYVLVEDIKCFFEEKLDVCGLVLFGMLFGLLGMEVLEGCQQLYMVELVYYDGIIEFFVQY